MPHELPPDDELDALLERGLGYAFSLTHDQATAEDVVQDACVRLMRARGDWCLPYLLRTIRAVVIDRWRHERLRPVVAVDASHLEAVPDRDDPLAGLARLPCSTEDVVALLGRLRPEEREVLYLMAVEGMTATEVAALLDRPRGTILSLAHRAKARFRAAIATPWRA